MEKYLYLTSGEYAVLLHLTGNRCVTGFSMDFPEDTQTKRRLLFDMFRKGIICNREERFEVASEWKEVFGAIQKADRVLWISFRDPDRQDMLFYICDGKAVCTENLSDVDHDLYRVSMRSIDSLKKEMKENGMFPRIRMNRNDGEMMDEHLGVTAGSETECLCTFSVYRNGETKPRERALLEREQLIYYVRTETADGSVRRRALSDETERILNRYMKSEV